MDSDLNQHDSEGDTKDESNEEVGEETQKGFNEESNNESKIELIDGTNDVSNNESKIEFKEDSKEESYEERKDEPKEIHTKSGIKSILSEILIYGILFFTCLYIIPNFVIQRTVVSGPSMENTLEDKDQLLIDKISYKVTDPKRFDIIVFYPHGKDVKEYYVKRVIGLPGETIQIIGKDIYIDGEILEESYGKDPITYSGIAEEPIELGSDEYFVLGDNRKVSLDSRYEEVGILKRDVIAGKAILRIWPFSKFGTLE